MAGNTVTLSFVGETSNLEQATSRAGSSIDRVGDASSRTAGRVNETGGALSKATERFDTLDTRAMGYRDTLTGVQDTMKAFNSPDFWSLDNLVTLGMGIGDLASGMVNLLLPALGSLSVGFRAMWVAATGPIGLLVIGIGLAVAAFLWLWNNCEGFRNFIIGAWEWIKKATLAAIDLLVAGLRRMGSFFISVWNSVKSSVGSAVSWIVGAWNGVMSFFSGLPGRVGSFFRAVGDAILSPFRSAFNAIRSLWNSTVGRISFTIPTWVPVIGGRGFSMPKFHQGGVVPGPPGSEMMAILQAGERVIPADRSGGGGNTEVRFTGNTSDALATVIMQMIRTGKIVIA